MPDDTHGSRGLPLSYLTASGSSFTDFLRLTAPELLPGRRPLPPGLGASLGDLAPHGTTIVSATFAGGVIVAGDRRATMGNLIASRDMEKVFAADSHSVVGIAGTAGIALEMVRLFQVELEHYEKVEGTSLSLDGKANRLALMIRGNLSVALQGLAVVPMFAGFDVDATDPGRGGRIFSYDVTGGIYEERDYHGVGSGSTFAKSALKKLWRRNSDRDTVVANVVEALYDAADDDTATGGPDPTRKLYPVVYVADASGASRVADDTIATIAEAVIAERAQRNAS